MKIKTYLLAGTASLLAFTPIYSKPANALCTTAGAITVSCTLSANTTGSIVLGSTNTGVSILINNDIILGHTINDDDVNPDGIISTDGLGRTITQTAVIGAIDNLASITLGLGDVWDSSASIYSSAIDLNAGTMNINNGGGLNGSVIDGGGVGTLNFGADTLGGTFNFGGTIDTVALTLTSGTLNSNGHNVGTGTALDAVTVNAGATFNLDDNLISIGALTNNGTIRINSTKVLEIADHTASPGTFIFEVDTSTKYGSILVSGPNDVDMTGATIKAEVGLGDILNNDELLIADGLNAVNAGAGQTAQIIPDNSYIWDFTMVDGSQPIITTVASDNTQLYIVVIEANPINTAAATKNNANAGNMLDSLSNTLDTQLQDLITNMNTAPTRTALNDILESVQPSVDGSHMAGALNLADSTSKIITKRLDYIISSSANYSGLSGGYNYNNNNEKTIADGWKVWGEFLTKTTKQDKKSGIDGFEATTYGVSLGVDTETYIDNFIFGAAYSYSQTDANSKNTNNTTTDTSSHQATVYGSYTPENSSAYYNSALAISWNQTATNRHNVGGVVGLNANGDADGSLYSIQGETGKRYVFPNNMIITPSFSGHLMHYITNSYTETGAFGANLAVKSKDLDILEAGPGVNIKWISERYDNSIFEPEVRFKYYYNFINDKVRSTNRFIGDGTSFIIDGYETGRNSLSLGTSLNYISPHKWEAKANYDFEYKDSYNSHTGSLRLSYKL